MMMGPEMNITDPFIYRTSTVNPITLVFLIFDSFPHYINRLIRLRPGYSFPSTTITDFSRVYLGKKEISIVVSLAFFFTFLRYFIVSSSQKWMKNHLILPRYWNKLPESVWKLLYYGTAWFLSLYVHTCLHDINTFNDPLSLWNGWGYNISPSMHPLVAIIYAIQSGFYLHSIYATLFMDAWRKDSWLMFIHHFIALSLLLLSYVDNFVLCGALVLFLQDNSDAALEIAKMFIYCKKRSDGTYYKTIDLLSGAFFLLFAIIWVIFRLYWYPCKLLYGTLYGAVYLGPQDAPFFPVLGVMLILIFLMNIYWFTFIARMLWRVARTGEEPEDNREWDTTAVSGIDKKTLDRMAQRKQQ